ncbi:hypothetical protein LWP59_32720 [Amycolatopsis acidiphila]|uniref:DUF3592 domain-containing protein n=1 Tax=Amycolatopsis acidiphila TaxID=715473 RepID=A0A558AE68_9PSEU|nr:hypothetical protein [Amycolatopsis acidiphila]TVT22560.1 hypothetical protein FNH06_13140 [Amycolatopsis acidiphila]UIJ58804.1 hypothetical protein LWP59_32720 [Amycolatopsis acidiphila]GHG72059.1 hypothetical protein GCM10017788_34260 [Amycolatopsis acidiphila]
MAGSPAGALARRLGIRTGRVVAPAGLAAIALGAVLFVLPPHSTIAALVAGIAGVAAFGLGMVRFAGGPWWALIIAVASGALLFAAVTVAGRGLALHTFGLTETCQVVQREEVDTRSRYQHYGFVHTISCPRGGTFMVRTDSTDRQQQGAEVAVLDDPGGLLDPDFASRHNLAVEITSVLGSIALVAASVRFTRTRVRAAS